MKKTLVVQYCTRSNMKTGYELTQARDISERSMIFTTSRYYENGTILDISFRLPGISDPVNVCGKVVRCQDHVEGYDFGYKTSLEFIDISNKSRTALSAAVDFVWGKETNVYFLHQGRKDQTLPATRTIFERDERVKKNLMFRYRHVNSNEQPILNYAVNISRSGILFRTEKPYDKNDTFELNFNLPSSDEPVKIYGKVARCVMLNHTIYDTAVKYEKISTYFHSALNDALFDGQKAKAGTLPGLVVLKKA